MKRRIKKITTNTQPEKKKALNIHLKEGTETKSYPLLSLYIYIYKRLLETFTSYYLFIYSLNLKFYYEIRIL